MERRVISAANLSMPLPNLTFPLVFRYSIVPSLPLFPLLVGSCRKKSDKCCELVSGSPKLKLPTRLLILSHWSPEGSVKQVYC